MNDEITKRIIEIEKEIRNTDISEQEKLENLYDELDALKACLD